MRKKNDDKSLPLSSSLVNWEEIKNKVNSVHDSLNQNVDVRKQEMKAILKARAEALAEKTEDDFGYFKHIELIVFQLATETYGIETDFVREVYPLKNFTKLPGVPDFVLGIINVRGQIISVIDLKKFFHLPEIGLGELNKVIIIRDAQMEFGVLADRILGSQSIPAETLQTSMSNAPGVGPEYLKGITKDHLIVLDAKKMLEDEKIIVNQ